MQSIVAANPFTPYMDVEIQPVVDPSAARATCAETLAALATAAQPAG